MWEVPAPPFVYVIGIALPRKYSPMTNVAPRMIANHSGSQVNKVMGGRVSGAGTGVE